MGSGSLSITSSRMGHLVTTISRVYRMLGLGDAVSGDDAFRLGLSSLSSANMTCSGWVEVVRLSAAVTVLLFAHDLRQAQWSGIAPDRLRITQSF